jgi:murein DD-endopeptidase MepM/ murein hydrolase activator NlpD
MKFTLLLISIITISLSSFANVKDTVARTNGDVLSLAPKRNGVQQVNRFDLFVDSINNTINDTMPFYDWVTNDIHFRKFDFSKVEDTLMVVLNDSNDHYTHPFDGNITSGFGKRRWRYHYGMDIDLNTGDTVRSAFNGRVRISTYSKTYGNVVVIRHDNGLETIYAHLSKRLVETDSIMSSGTVIGLGGNTGHSFGSHLHFEVRFFDEALDPRDIISFESYKLHYDTLAISQCNFRYRDELKLMKAIKHHRVRSGNTLGHIAVKYSTSISKLCRLNRISRNSILRIGQRIRVR